MACAVALVAAAMAPSQPVAAAEPFAPHASTVPASPRVNFPKILDGDVFAVEQVGSWIVMGGDFTRIALKNGTTTTQRRLAAFELATGDFVKEFRPSVDGPVLAIAPVPGGRGAVIAGKFATYNGTAKQNIARISLPTGALDGTFRAAAAGRITTMARTGERLFVGGDFTAVNGRARAALAEIDLRTGAPNPAFRIGVNGYRGGEVTGARVIALGLTPAGDRLVVMHRGQTVGGQNRGGAAIIDISKRVDPVLTDWQTDQWPSWDTVGITDGEVSPDGSYFVVTTIKGNVPPNHDTVIAFPTAGGAGVRPLWITQMFDSVFSVGISNNAVYVGGHFCWVEGPGSPTVWNWVPNPTGGNQYSCFQNGGGGFPHTVYRFHQAALDPATGHALPWNARANSVVGARAMTVTSRGLLIGHDGEKVNGVRCGRMCMLDIGGSSDTVAPTHTVTAPTPGASTTSPVTVRGKVTDNRTPWEIEIQIRGDGPLGKYVYPDGSMHVTPLSFYTRPTAQTSATAVNWSHTIKAPPGGKILRVRAFDRAGNASAWTELRYSQS